MNSTMLVKFDEELFKSALDAYKKVFEIKQWADEKYKWIAVQHSRPLGIRSHRFSRNARSGTIENR